MDNVITIVNNGITIQNDICAKATTISIDVGNIEKTMNHAKELFDYCKYNDAEQIFSKIKGSEASAWRILCYMVTGDIGRKGGKIATLLQESIKNQDADISETVTLLKTLIDKYSGAIDRKTKNKTMATLYDAFNQIIREKMITTISDIGKKALDIVKEKGYTPSIYDDRIVPLKVLNSKLKKYKYRIRHYGPDDIVYALKTMNNDNFIQEVVNEYMYMAQYSIINMDKDRLDTRNQDVLKYIRGLYVSNIVNERELKITKSIDRLQFIEILNKLNQSGWLRLTMMNAENTRYFNMANDEERTICEIEIEGIPIERTPMVNVITSLEYEDTIEKRGYLIYDSIVNQISKEDIVIGDVTNHYTQEYVGPVPGTIYCDN